MTDHRYSHIVEADEETFRVFVNDDIRNRAHEDVGRALRSSECVDRWYRALVSMKRNAELQITLDRADRSAERARLDGASDGKQLWMQYVKERDQWAAGNARFKAGVEDKIDEAKSIRNRPNNRIKELETAIINHRKEMEADASSADEDLWAVLR